VVVNKSRDIVQIGGIRNRDERALLYIHAKRLIIAAPVAKVLDPSFSQDIRRVKGLLQGGAKPPRRFSAALTVPSRSRRLSSLIPPEVPSFVHGEIPILFSSAIMGVMFAQIRIEAPRLDVMLSGVHEFQIPTCYHNACSIVETFGGGSE
jgi:hypothetical protein